MTIPLRPSFLAMFLAASLLGSFPLCAEERPSTTRHALDRLGAGAAPPEEVLDGMPPKGGIEAVEAGEFEPLPPPQPLPGQTPEEVLETHRALVEPEIRKEPLPDSLRQKSKREGFWWGAAIGLGLGALTGVHMAWALAWHPAGIVLAVLLTALGVYIGSDVGKALAQENAEEAWRKGELKESR